MKHRKPRRVVLGIVYVKQSVPEIATFVVIDGIVPKPGQLVRIIGEIIK